MKRKASELAMADSTTGAKKLKVDWETESLVEYIKPIWRPWETQERSCSPVETVENITENVQISASQVEGILARAQKFENLLKDASKNKMWCNTEDLTVSETVPDQIFEWDDTQVSYHDLIAYCEACLIKNLTKSDGAESYPFSLKMSKKLKNHVSSDEDSS